ncbi:unannotated protein [freshwater metagenome]|uniref:Unannotated protein n=1 Tax=freshwater metagenome TaxID=449393 RepID=A0A6J5YLN7_9ZZZZ
MGSTGAMMPTFGGSAGSGIFDGLVTSVALVAAEFQAMALMSVEGTRTRNDTSNPLPEV